MAKLSKHSFVYPGDYFIFFTKPLALYYVVFMLVS